jgi:hypothetical protein
MEYRYSIVQWNDINNILPNCINEQSRPVLVADKDSNFLGVSTAIINQFRGGKVTIAWLNKSYFEYDNVGFWAELPTIEKKFPLIA